MVHLTIPQQKEKLGYSFSDKTALCCWHCYFENWNSNFISTATFQLSIVSSTKPQLPLQFNFPVTITVQFPSLLFSLRKMNRSEKKKSRKERRRDKNRTHQSWKSETQETKKQVKKKGTDNGQSWGERGRQRVRRRWEVKALCPLELLAYLPSLNIALSLLSPAQYCPLENWLAKADMTRSGNDLANMNLLERNTYSWAQMGQY